MKEVVEFTANARIRIGDREFKLSGKGGINDPKGIVTGNYLHDLPANDFEPYVLQVVLVTGYPSVCRSTLEQNPFKAGDYNYERHVDLGAYGELTYAARCWTEEFSGGRRLRSEFDVRCDVRLPRLRPAHRVSEIWTPQGDKIHSRFDISWPIDGSDERVEARAHSIYSPSAAALARQVRRGIEFSDVVRDDAELSLVQESWLESDA